jgi:hypothetical protein
VKLSSAPVYTETHAGGRPQHLRKLTIRPMAYSKKAKRLRRCTYRYPEGHTRAGERCKAYARWQSDWKNGNGLCVAHGTEGRGSQKRRGERVEHKPRPLCDCAAYSWPHRPGGGLCRWPDPPKYVCTIPEGTRAPWRRGNGGRRWPRAGYPVKTNTIPPERVRVDPETAVFETTP